MWVNSRGWDVMPTWATPVDGGVSDGRDDMKITFITSLMIGSLRLLCCDYGVGEFCGFSYFVACGKAFFMWWLALLILIKKYVILDSDSKENNLDIKWNNSVGLVCWCYPNVNFEIKKNPYREKFKVLSSSFRTFWIMPLQIVLEVYVPLTKVEGG